MYFVGDTSDIPNTPPFIPFIPTSMYMNWYLALTIVYKNHAIIYCTETTTKVTSVFIQLYCFSPFALTQKLKNKNAIRYYLIPQKSKLFTLSQDSCFLRKPDTRFAFVDQDHKSSQCVWRVLVLTASRLCDTISETLSVLPNSNLIESSSANQNVQTSRYSSSRPPKRNKTKKRWN